MAIPQTLISVTPSTGAGLTPVTVVGTGFIERHGHTAVVLFGTVPALNITVVSSTEITCTAPEEVAGIVNVILQQSGGTGATLVSGFVFTGALVAASYNFQDPSGAPLANGTVTFRLSTDVMAGSVQLSASRLVKASLDSGGNLAINLWPNNQMTPAGTVYIVKAYTALGQLVWEGELTVTDNTVPSFLLLETSHGRAYDFLLLENGGQIELE
jgi:hypothetical protein